MKQRIKKVKYKTIQRTVGQRPGTITIDADALQPVITVYSYNADELVTSKGEDISVVIKQLKICTDHTHWIQIQGLGDAKLLTDIGTHLNVSVLVLEDIVNTHQRPKYDDYEEYAFAVSRVIRFNDNHELVNCQFSALIKDNMLISFEETHDDYFEAIKTRLSAGKGIIRTAGPSYMLYALSDTVLDHYFIMLSQIGETLDAVEDRLYAHADKTIMYDTQQLKRSFIILRRAIWPERDKINEMLRADTLIKPEVKPFLRDAYDHCVQIMDLLENYKEITSSIIDLYLSMVSNRMNEIMKVLTIISAIFIPLTFIAGIYGMNFAKVDPVTNKVMPDNMPELYSAHGYIYALVGMGVIGLIQIIIFWKKGWFTKL